MPSPSTLAHADSPPVWRRLLAPLNLAAYAVWGLLVFNQIGTGAAAARGSSVWFGCLLSLGIFLLAFVARELVEYRSRRLMYVQWTLAVQATAALANLALVYDGINPILFILIAAQLPAVVSVPIALVVLGVLDTALYFLLRDTHDQLRPAFNVAVFGTFQAFAMLTTLFAVRAERANSELQAVNAHLLATRGLLEEGVRDGERLRLSRELHDVAGHTLTALKLHLELALRLADESQRRSRIESAMTLADGLLEDVRGVVTQLRRHDGVDLPGVLTTLCRGFPGIDARLTIDPGLRITDVERAETIVRSIQEALTNAVRHGAARRIAIDLTRTDDAVHVRIADDGRGARRVRFGNGLNGIRERLVQHGSHLHVETRPGEGFVLTFALPDASAPAS